MYPIAEAPLAGTESEAPPVAAIILGAIRRRWWLLLIIACISGGAAYLVATQFGGESAVASATLIHTGLPAVSTKTVYEPLSPATCAELITSVDLLGQLSQSRGLDVPPSQLRELIEAKVTRNSSYMTVTYQSGSAEEGIGTLNSLLDMFVTHIATLRRETLREHIRHVEDAVLRSRTEADEIQQQLLTLRERQQKQLEEGGLVGEEYKSLLAQIAATELTIDEKRVQQAGVLDQVNAVRSQIDAVDQEAMKHLEAVKREIGRATSAQIARMKANYAESSSAHRNVNEFAQAASRFGKSKDGPADLESWVAALEALFAKYSDQFWEADVDALKQAYTEILSRAERRLQGFESTRQGLLRQKQQLELSLIPIEKQVGMLEQRLADYRRQADEVVGQVAGTDGASLVEFEARLQEARSKQSALAAQLDAMRELEKCRVNEWTASTRASEQTTELSSNRKKLFVLVFGLCGMLLSSPVLLAEWHRQRKAPVARFAESLQLPVLAERVLQDFMPGGRESNHALQPSEKTLEAIRSLTLRIQQSAHRSGAVILFSSLDATSSPARLVAAVAECLAEREERVLVVDAVCPSQSPSRLLNLLVEPTNSKTEEGARADGSGSAESGPDRPPPGLAEYLSEECESLSELVRPSGRPGVDMISSGTLPFPREAMASSCLTELIESCRRNYTMILVNGPAATASTDVQMLTARADGVVLVAGKTSKSNLASRAAVLDLIGVGSPIIGIVA